MKTKNIKQNLKEYFFNNPTTKMRVRQIERTLKAPLPSIIRYTKELESENTLKSSEIAGIRVYSADRASKNFIIEKKLFNIYNLFNSGLIEYLIKEYNNSLIIVFGSYSKGEDIETSDIDIYIETLKKQVFNLEKFEKILQRKIQIFNYSNLDKIQNKELANNIINGLILNGFLEVFK